MPRHSAIPPAEQFHSFAPPGHACIVTEHDSECLALIARFLRMGLERDEQCVYLHGEGDEGPLLQAFEQEGIDMEAAHRSKTLVLISPRATNVRGDSFDPYRLVRFWKDLASRARAAGFAATRCAIATSSFVFGPAEADRWLEYESQLTAVAEEHRWLFLCHYPRQVAAKQLLDVVRSHSRVIHAGEIAPNLLYLPSRDTPEADPHQLALDSLLDDLANRARLERLAGERKQAEEQHRRAQAYFADGERLSHTGSWAWSVASQEISFWSPGYLRILGLEPNTTPSSAGVRALVHPDDVALVEGNFVRALRERGGFDCEFRILTGDTVRHVRSVGRPVFDQHGELAEYAGTLIDITEQHDAETALRASQSTLARVARLTTLGELSTSIAHEVNQPLGAIILHGDAARRWLTHEPPNAEETLRAIEGMMANAHRAREVIARIRTLASQADRPHELLDLNEIVREVLEVARGELTQAAILVTTQLSAAWVRGDRVQLQQVLLNLIMNAIEAMSAREQGRRELDIRISEDDPESVHVEVRDSGIGVTEHSLGKLFEPFYTTKPQGTGIGLSISRSIIEAHTGRLWARRNEPAPGLSLHIALPRAFPGTEPDNIR